VLGKDQLQNKKCIQSRRKEVPRAVPKLHWLRDRLLSLLKYRGQDVLCSLCVRRYWRRSTTIRIGPLNDIEVACLETGATSAILQRLSIKMSEHFSISSFPNLFYSRSRKFVALCVVTALGEISYRLFLLSYRDHIVHESLI
jgi:hypothetical protein